LKANEKKEREMKEKLEKLEREYNEIKFSLNTYGKHPPLPATFAEYAKSKGIIVPVKKA